MKGPFTPANWSGSRTLARMDVWPKTNLNVYPLTLTRTSTQLEPEPQPNSNLNPTLTRTSTQLEPEPQPNSNPNLNPTRTPKAQKRFRENEMTSFFGQVTRYRLKPPCNGANKKQSSTSVEFKGAWSRGSNVRLLVGRPGFSSPSNKSKYLKSWSS